MSKNSNREKTPITFGAFLTEQEVKNIKLLAVDRSITMRTFLEEAMEAHVAARVAAEKSAEKFNYLRVPRDATRIPVYADEGVLEIIDSWAEKDNVARHDAIYTAFATYIKVCTKNFKGIVD